MHFNQKTQTDFKTLLVVVSADDIEATKPMEAPLVQRALLIAGATGANIEFFQVCYDASLDWALLRDEEEVAAAKRKLLDDSAAELAEALVHMDNGLVETSYDVRWHKDPTAATLAKAREISADLIVKVSKAHRYLFGLTNNTDWSLLRGAAVPVWFVKDNAAQPLNRILAAVGCSDSRDIFDPSDHATLQVATVLRELTATELWMTHSFQVPRHLPLYAGYAPTLGTAHSYENIYNLNAKRARDLAKRHGQALRHLAATFGLQTDRIVINEGPAAMRITETAGDINADLLIMGVGEKSLLQRILSDANAEPVLADADCDVLFVPGTDAAKDDAGEDLRKFNFDLEQAIVDPAAVFKNPREVVDLPRISVHLRRRILLAWRHDTHIHMTDIAEGADTSEPHAATLLQDINAAIDRLDEEADTAQRRSA